MLGPRIDTFAPTLFMAAMTLMTAQAEAQRAAAQKQQVCVTAVRI